MAEKPQVFDSLGEMKESIIIKLIMLVGACRTKTIKKSQIEQSLQKYIKTVGEMKINEKIQK